MPSDWFWQLLKYEGKPVDAYLSQKIIKSNDRKFGFIRYQTKVEAREVAKRIDGLVFRNYKVKVNKAKY